MLQLSRRERSLLTLLFAAGVAVVIIGSLLPSNSPVMTTVAKLPFTDKALHFTAYLALGTLAALARPGLRTAMTVTIGLALLGAALELAQGLVPGRTPELADEGANVLGSVCGMIVGHLAAAKTAPATIES